MAKTIIFCEGITDLFFIGHCLDIFFGLDFNHKYNQKKRANQYDVGNNCLIVEIGGCEQLTNPAYLDMLKDNTVEGGKNIVIFDADFAPDSSGHKQGTGNNGFHNAKKKLENLKRQKEVEFDFYLWHDNENDGEIEDLITNLIPDDKQKLIDCMNTHKECLSTLQISNLNIPDKKKILGHYVYTLQQEPHDYKCKETWNLNIQDSIELKKFSLFLETHFAK